MSTQPPRQKRWASRARTGCQTCRLRRVKCDEAQPICKKCAVGGRDCHYTLNSQRPGAATIAAAEKQKGRVLLPLHRTEPPDWDYMQAVRYYFTAVRPHRAGEFEAIVDPPFHIQGDWCIGFTCKVICDRLENSCKAHGRLLRPGEDPALAGLWASYWRYLHKHLVLINKIVSEKVVVENLAIAPLMDLMAFDLVAQGIFWQLHMNGLFAYIENIGGIKFILSQPRVPYKFASLMHRAITSNTTSPASGQVLGHHHYTDKQLRKVLDSDISSDMPCPTDLYIALAHISLVRHRAALDRLEKQEEVYSLARQVLADITDFDPVSWANKNEFVSKDITLLIGQLYHAAVRLFSTMTLPRAAVLAAYPCATSYQSLRASQRRALVELIKQGLCIVEFSHSLAWPVIVAGVAAGTAHDEAEADPDYNDALRTQEFADQYYYNAWMKPIASIVDLLILQKLRSFWQSGKTAWDDCFHEPTAC
ncbi:hypothetical protein MY11210_002808 [Beauveria gryllotalpidicola]